MSDKYVHARTCVYKLNYHLARCTKYRRKVLTPEVADRLWKGHLWNGSYFVESIGSTSEENILKYIERQKNVAG